MGEAYEVRIQKCIKNGSKVVREMDPKVLKTRPRNGQNRVREMDPKVLKTRARNDQKRVRNMPKTGSAICPKPGPQLIQKMAP